MDVTSEATNDPGSEQPPHPARWLVNYAATKSGFHRLVHRDREAIGARWAEVTRYSMTPGPLPSFIGVVVTLKRTDYSP